jgi:hypothetical protein
MDDINQILKLKEIDQLDVAILQFSKNTLASKKLCATLLVGIISIISQITKDCFDIYFFISCGLTLSVFWVIDSISYYYQQKLRVRMTEIANELKKNDAKFIGFGMPLQKVDKKVLWKMAFFNNSQWFYYCGFIILLCSLFVRFICKCVVIEICV